MAEKISIKLDTSVNDEAIKRILDDLIRIDRQLGSVIDGVVLLDDAFKELDATGVDNVSDSISFLNSSIRTVEASLENVNQELQNNNLDFTDSLIDGFRDVGTELSILRNDLENIDVNISDNSLNNLESSIVGLQSDVNALSNEFEDLNSKPIDDVGDSYEDVNEAVDDNTKAVKNNTKAVDDNNDATETTNDNLKKTDSGVKTVSSAFSNLGTALKGLGIGLILTAIGALFNIISKNQKVVDAFTTANNFLSLAFNSIVDAVSKAFTEVDKLTGGFDATAKVIDDLITITFAQFESAFYFLQLAILNLQLLYEDSFLGGGDEGRIKELNESIETVTQNIKDLGQTVIDSASSLVENFGEAITEVTSLGSAIIDEVSEISGKAILEQAKTITQLANSSLIAQAVNRGLIEQYDIQAESLRQIRDNDLISISDRIEANDKLLLVLKEQEKVMLENADIAVASAQANLAVNNNIENQVALQEALNERQAITAQINGQISEQEVNRTQLIKERLDLENDLSERENTRLLSRQRADAELIDNELIRLERLREIAEEEQEIEQERLEGLVELYKEGTQARQDAEQDLLDFQSESRSERIELERDIEEQRRTLYKDSFDAILALTNSETALGKAVLLAKQFILAQELIMEVKRLTFRGKSAVAESTVAIAEGTAQSAKIGFPQNIPMLIGFAAQAVGIVSAVNSAVSGLGSLGASVGGGAQAPVAPTVTQPPQFNIVGSSDTNQLAQVVSEQSDKPLKAFVVSSDVTSQQQLDRQVRSTAQIGS